MTNNVREETIAALRAFADLLENHPDLPIPDIVGNYFPNEGTDKANMDEVDRAAAILKRPTSRRFGDTHYTVVRDFSSRVRYAVCAISDADLDRMAEELRKKVRGDTEGSAS